VGSRKTRKVQISLSKRKRCLLPHRLLWVSFLPLAGPPITVTSRERFMGKASSKIPATVDNILSMPGSNWIKAIQAVLEQAAQPLAATQIADAIADRNLIRNRTALPVARVAREITASIEKYGNNSPIVRQTPGKFGLRSWGIPPSWFDTGLALAEDELRLQRELTGFINAFGMFWERKDVRWSGRPRLLGQQQASTKTVDFALKMERICCTISRE
jgi:hypothetical protein